MTNRSVGVVNDREEDSPILPEITAHQTKISVSQSIDPKRVDGSSTEYDSDDSDLFKPQLKKVRKLEHDPSSSVSKKVSFL